MSKTKTISLTVGAFVAGALISLNFPAMADKEAKQGLPIEELRTFAEVYSAIKQGYVEPVDDKKMIANAISGMLSNLDPHSTYLDADAFKDLQVGTQGEFGGLGIEVGMEDGLVKVVSPIEDTPAYRAGLKSGDLIFKLDDTPVKGLTLADAVKKMRGKPKTPIKLSIIRKGETKPIEVTLIREVIKVQSVKSKLVEPGYGWVRVTQFQENTTAEVAKHVAGLYKDGNKLQGLVLDLRNDPGGLLNSAIGVSAAFLPPDAKVVSTDGRTADAKQEFRARAQDYLRGSKEDPLKALPIEAKNVPMIVLVNGGSASASEIVAGALQDHKRAIIVGTQSFGKGSVQSVLPLPGNTAIKLTTARYYTPEGRSIQAKGITPDIVVEESANGASPGMHLREADLDRHLSNDRDKEANKEAAKPEAKGQAKPGKNGKDRKDDSEEDMPQRLEYATKGDYQFQQALNLLKGLQIMQNKSQ